MTWFRQELGSHQLELLLPLEWLDFGMAGYASRLCTISP